MLRPEYLRVILYGMLITMVSSFATLVFTMLAAYDAKVSVVLTLLIPTVILTLYCLVLHKHPGEGRLWTGADPVDRRLTMQFVSVMTSYLVLSGLVFCNASSTVGGGMLLGSLLFIVAGFVIEGTNPKKSRP